MEYDRSGLVLTLFWLQRKLLTHLNPTRMQKNCGEKLSRKKSEKKSHTVKELEWRILFPHSSILKKDEKSFPPDEKHTRKSWTIIATMKQNILHFLKMKGLRNLRHLDFKTLCTLCIWRYGMSHFVLLQFQHWRGFNQDVCRWQNEKVTETMTRRSMTWPLILHGIQEIKKNLHKLVWGLGGENSSKIKSLTLGGIGNGMPSKVTPGFEHIH